MLLRLLLAGAVLGAGTACGESPTAPTETAAPPEFASQLTPRGTASRGITLKSGGVISVTLTRVTPEAVLGLGVGIPRANGSGCALSRSVDTGPGASPQISMPAGAGEFCVQVYDPGTLTETVSFAVTIDIP